MRKNNPDEVFKIVVTLSSGDIFFERLNVVFGDMLENSNSTASAIKRGDLQREVDTRRCA